MKLAIFLMAVYVGILYLSKQPRKEKPVDLFGCEPTKAELLEEISFIINKDVTGSMLAVKKDILAELLEKLK